MLNLQTFNKTNSGTNLAEAGRGGLGVTANPMSYSAVLFELKSPGNFEIRSICLNQTVVYSSSHCSYIPSLSLKTEQNAKNILIC